VGLGDGDAVGDGDGDGDGDRDGDGDGDPPGEVKVPEGEGRAEWDGVGFDVGFAEDGVCAGRTGTKARARCAGNSEPMGVGLAEAAGDDAATGGRLTDDIEPRLDVDGSRAYAK
jgi:hypothetical protein